jgi:hypothetical protein
VLACNPPVQTSDWLTVGTLDANSKPAQVGRLDRFDVKQTTRARRRTRQT